MDNPTDQISEAEMAKKMRKRLKTTFNDALEAHDKAMNSQSDVAKYNSSMLRKLEKAFMANPEVDLLSKIPSTYKSSLEELANNVTNEADGLHPAFPPSKRVKTSNSTVENDVQKELPKHLQHLQGPGPVVVKSTIHESITNFFNSDMTANNVIDTLCSCEVIAQNIGSGTKMIIRLGEESVVKIRPTGSDTREYSTLLYLDQHCPEIPAPKPRGMIELNGQDFMFTSLISGESLDKVWTSLNQKQKVSVVQQLDETFSVLRRQIPRDSQPWGGVGGEGCKDQRRRVRISDQEILNAQAFEDFYFSNPKFGSDVYIKFLRKLYAFSNEDHGGKGSCVLTHGDLRQANIMVQVAASGEVTVSGVVDWECSGFYPEWWESAKLTNCMGPHETDDWYLHIPASISPLRYPTQWLLDLAWDKHVD